MSNNPPFTHLTYKSAAVSVRATSDLASPRPRPRRLPFPRDIQRSVTTLGATSHIRPTDQTHHSTSAISPRSPRQPKRLFRQIQDDVPHRTRSMHRFVPKASLTRAPLKPKAKSSVSAIAATPPPRQPSRTVYHATTASARAAELAKTIPANESILLQSREGGERTEREGAELPAVTPRGMRREDDNDTCAQSMGADSAASGKRGARIVVKRRLIRGTSVFRPATEAELEEFLQRERYREMVMCPTAAIDFPPALANTKPLAYGDLMDSERELCAQCLNPLTTSKRQMIGKRGVRRVSSLLSKHLGLDSDMDHTLDITEMAALDECTAVALFLKEIRRCRRDMLTSMHDKAYERTVDRTTALERKKEIRRVAKERRHGRRDESGKYSRLLLQRRSLSADDPVLMRALIRQEHLLSHASNRKRKSVSQKCILEDGTDSGGKCDVADDNHDHERSCSEVAIRSGRTRNREENFGQSMGSIRRGENGNNGRGYSKTVTIAKNDQNRLEQKPDSGADKGESVETEEEEEDGANGVRILTAIEPVDPSLGPDEEDGARRGTSYHVGSGALGYAGSRRRYLTRGINGGESNFLRRLRSLRWRTDE